MRNSLTMQLVAVMMKHRTHWRKSQSRITISSFDSLAYSAPFASRVNHDRLSVFLCALSYLLSVKTSSKTILFLTRCKVVREKCLENKACVSTLFDLIRVVKRRIKTITPKRFIDEYMLLCFTFIFGELYMYMNIFINFIDIEKSISIWICYISMKTFMSIQFYFIQFRNKC